VAGLVLLSTGLRIWAARQIPGPWITPDESIYGLLGSSLYRTGRLAILGGPTPFYSLVEPIVVGPWLAFSDLELGHRVLQGIQPIAAGAVVLAAATRLQAIVLLPAFLTALLVDAALARSAERLRRLAPAVGALVVIAAAWLTWRLASGRALLGGYALVSHSSY